jgi:hypothetical protein
VQPDHQNHPSHGYRGYVQLAQSFTFLSRIAEPPRLAQRHVAPIHLRRAAGEEAVSLRTTAVVTTAVHGTRSRIVARGRRLGREPERSRAGNARFPAPARPYPLFAYRTVWDEEETTEDDDPPPETVEEEKLPSS